MGDDGRRVLQPRVPGGAVGRVAQRVGVRAGRRRWGRRAARPRAGSRPRAGRGRWRRPGPRAGPAPSRPRRLEAAGDVEQRAGGVGAARARRSAARPRGSRRPRRRRASRRPRAPPRRSCPPRRRARRARPPPPSAALSAASERLAGARREARDRGGVGVQRRRARRGDRELDAVAAHALADAQVEDRHVVDGLGVEHEDGVGELEVGRRSPAATGCAARASSSAPGRRASCATRCAASRAPRAAAAGAGSPPRWWRRRRPAPGPSRRRACRPARGLVQRALPGDGRAARRRRAAAAR